MAVVASLLPAITLHLGTLSIETPKRKKSGHYGLVDNSSLPVRLVVLSRLVRSADEPTLVAAATSALGSTVLVALRRVALSVALSAGCADPSMSEGQMQTLFNTPASTVHTKRLYDQQLSLPAKLPQPNAKELLDAMLEAVGAVRPSPAGLRVAELLLGGQGLGADEAAVVDTLAASVEQATVARLGGSSAIPLPPAAPSPPPQLPTPPLVPTDVSTALDPGASLITNFVHHLASRWGRPLSPEESNIIAGAMEQGLLVMQAGDAAATQSLLEGGVLAALSNAPAAQLWACCLEVGERGLTSASAVAEALVNACSAITTVLFADALGL
jgi:hypothetical protein